MMREEFLYYLWSYYLSGKTFTTVDGKKLVVDKPGQRNSDSGPDFFNARVTIDNTVWAGNVELHVYSSDWYKHHHGDDKIYDSVILHVVYDNNMPVYRKSGEKIPCLALNGKVDDRLFSTYQRFLLSRKWIACAHELKDVPYINLYHWLQRLSVERLQEKATIIKEELHDSQGNFMEVFYRQLFRGFGFKVNAEAFEQLAVSLPFSLLQKHKNDLLQLEALLLGQSGLLPKKVAIIMSIR